MRGLQKKKKKKKKKKIYQPDNVTAKVEKFQKHVEAIL